MITDQKLEYYKEQYNGHKLIYVRFSNEDFVFRTLTIKEYEMISKIYSEEFKKETAICNMACIYPEGYEFSECEFGVLPSVISGYIKKISDFDNVEDIFNEYDEAKASYNNLFQQCMDLIKSFIKDYTYEEMEDWTWEKIMQMTVIAENIAKLQGFDYHIERNQEAIDNQKSVSIHNPETIETVLKNKINPLIYFKDELKKELQTNNNMVDAPFIIGTKWNNKELLDGFKEQKVKQQRRTE